MAGPPGGSPLIPAPDTAPVSARRQHAPRSSSAWRACRPGGARSSPEWGLWHLTPAYRGWGHTYPISPAPLKPLVTQPTLPPHQHLRPEAPNHLHAVVRERTTRPFGPKCPIVIDNHPVSRFYYITWLNSATLCVWIPGRPGNTIIDDRSNTCRSRPVSPECSPPPPPRSPSWAARRSRRTTRSSATSSVTATSRFSAATTCRSRCRSRSTSAATPWASWASPTPAARAAPRPSWTASTAKLTSVVNAAGSRGTRRPLP
jgi:hypothetical protein